MPEAGEFLIAGGGPAGATAATLLAARGQRVVLVERCAEAHHKVCGEFLSYEALRCLEKIGLRAWDLGALPIRTVRVAADDLIAEAALPFEAASLSRKVLDAALLRTAQEYGARLMTGRQVEQLAPDGRGWRMQLNDGQELLGGQVMLATGKHDLRGHPRGTGTQAGLVAFKTHLQLQPVQMLAMREAVEVVLFPGGYVGLQPAERGEVNVCLLVRGDVLRRVGGQWAGVLRHLMASSRFLRERLKGAEECFGRPLALSHIPYGYVRGETQPGLWALGDQAAVIPSFCGDGIAIALHSACLAAALSAAGKDAAAFTRQMYGGHLARVKHATLLSCAMIGIPRASSLLRFFPGLLRPIAQATRIPPEMLQAALN